MRKLDGSSTLLYELKLTSKWGKGIAAPLSACSMSRHRKGEMLFFDHVIPTVVLKVKVGFGSALLLPACQREHYDHDNGNEGNAANGYSNDGPWR